MNCLKIIKTTNQFHIVIIFLYHFLTIASKTFAIDSGLGLGPLCFNCSKLRNPYFCNVITRCELHEKCGSSYAFYGDPYQTLLWNLGCVKDSDCKTRKRRSLGEDLASTSYWKKDNGSIFNSFLIEKRIMRNFARKNNAYNVNFKSLNMGRSRMASFSINDHIVFTACNDCCNGDYCNTKPCHHGYSLTSQPTGLLCHSCQDVASVSKCFQMNRCNLGEHCAVWVSSTNGLYSMGCKPTTQCPVQGSSTMTFKSKRLIQPNFLNYKILHPNTNDYKIAEVSHHVSSLSSSKSDKNSPTLYLDSSIKRSLASSLHSPSVIENRKSHVGVLCSECCNRNFCGSDLLCHNLKQPFSVLMTPANATVVEGENVTFECNITGGASPGNVSFVLTTQITAISFELSQCRHNFSITPYKAACTLKQVSKSLIGVVSCIASTIGKPTKEFFNSTLNVINAAVPLSIILKPSDLVIVEGGSPQTVLCKANGFPMPQCHWYKNDSLMGVQEINTRPGFNVSTSPNGSSILTVDNIKHTDDGNYFCQVKNSRQTLNLPFSIQTVTNITTVNGLTGELIVDKTIVNISFECTFHSYPKPTVTWELQPPAMPPLNKHTNVTITTSDIDDATVVSHVTVPASIVRDANATEIQCSADNGFDTNAPIITTSSLRILRPPTILSPAANYTVKFGDPLHVRCDVDGDPYPTISWFFLNSLNNPAILSPVSLEDSNRSLKVYSLKQSGMLTCVAGNSQGSDSVLFEINLI